MEPESDLTIHEIVLSVNGKNVSINTEGNIHYHNIADDKEIYDSQSLFCSCGIVAASIENAEGLEMPLTFTASDDVIIDKFEFGSFFTVKEADVYIDGVFVGLFEDVFPLELNENETVYFNIKRADCGDDYEFLSNFYLDEFLYYHNEKEGERILKNGFAVCSVYDESSLKKLVERVLEKREQKN